MNGGGGERFWLRAALPQLFDRKGTGADRCRDSVQSKAWEDRKDRRAQSAPQCRNRQGWHRA
eukprot:01458_2